MYTDKVTTGMEKISHAKVLIETDVSKVLPESIELIVSSGTFQQRITYEWKPKFCHDCLKLGHEDANCWKKVQEQPGEVHGPWAMARRNPQEEGENIDPLIRNGK